MTRSIDIFLTFLFISLFGWASIHGLSYDTFNADTTYHNTSLDKILPLISLVGHALIICSLFIKTKKGYLTFRLIGISLVIPLIINFKLQASLNNNLPLDKIVVSTVNVEMLLILVFFILSVFRRFDKQA